MPDQQPRLFRIILLSATYPPIGYRTLLVRCGRAREIEMTGEVSDRHPDKVNLFNILFPRRWLRVSRIAE